MTRIALAQVGASENKSDNTKKCLTAIDRAADAGAGIVIFPELAALQFFPQFREAEWAREVAEPVPGPTTDLISTRAGNHGIVVVFNLYESTGDGEFFDSSPVIDADGSLLGVTRMVHITDYACFHERRYYHPGDRGAPVYDTRAGRIGVAICYDRHYPEYMRALAMNGADLVAIPQAGAAAEWPEGMYEAEVRAAAFQNGYFAALCNRVGREPNLEFAGESFVVGPAGAVMARAKKLEEDLITVDLDLSECAASPARTLFLDDRRPELYRDWLG